jgi:hypothetical protein
MGDFPEYRLSVAGIGGQMDNQLQLLPESVTDDMLSERDYAQGIYTGQHLKERDPARYEQVINLLADGSLSQRQISRLTGCSRNLISGVAKSQTADIEPVKQRLARKARNLAELCIDRAEELVLSGAKLGLKDLVVGAGVMADKSLLLSGEATQRIEVQRVDPDEFNRRFQSLPESARARLALMGLVPENSGAKREPIEAEYTESEGDNAR